MVALGWLLSPGRHAVTAALVATGISGIRHHAAFHRFFSSAKWSADAVGRCVFLWVLRLLDEEAPVPLALDDTLASKKGEKIFGLGNHIDPVRSTKKHKIFSFGHVWVAVAVVVRLPFCRRPWALPILFRLYRNKKECKRKGHPYRKKTELAQEMLGVLTGWVQGRRCEISADSAYCNGTVTKGMAQNIILFGSMRPDAALTDTPKKTKAKRMGRGRVRGNRLPAPEVVARDMNRPWRTLKADMYRRVQKITYKQMKAQWYRACGPRLLKIVITATTHGNIPYRIFFSTDPTLSTRYILERYASRWAIEVTFRDLKQCLGFADSQAWARKAVERTAPFVGMLFTIIVLWYAECGHGSRFDWFPIRPWYRKKTTPSFADMLAAAQRAVIASGVFDPARDYDNLQNRFRALWARRKRAG
jgi:SRSO17 transposase